MWVFLLASTKLPFLADKGTFPTSSLKAVGFCIQYHSGKTIDLIKLKGCVYTVSNTWQENSAFTEA